MSSFQVPVLGSTVRFFSLFPASLPQLFHRCLSFVFTPDIFHFLFVSFRPLPFSFQLLSLLFFLSFSSRFCLTAASPVPRFCSRFFGFPFLSGLISYAFLPGSCTQLYCWFPFSLPCFTPAAVPQVLTLCFRFRSFPFQFTSFRPFLFRFWLLSLCFFLSSLFLPSPHNGYLSAPTSLSLLWFSPFFPTWSPMSFSPILRTWLSVSFLSPFPDSLPQLFLRCLPYALAFGLSPSFSVSFRPLLFRFWLLSFLFLPFLFLPGSASQLLPQCDVSVFPLPFHPVSRDSLPFLRTRLSVCFLSSLPASLPQLFHRCSLCFRFRAFP